MKQTKSLSPNSNSSPIFCPILTFCYNQWRKVSENLQVNKSKANLHHEKQTMWKQEQQKYINKNSDNYRAESTCCMLSSSVHEGVGEENVCMADEKLCHNSLDADILQCSQAAILLLQVFTSVKHDQHGVCLHSIHSLRQYICQFLSVTYSQSV